MPDVTIQIEVVDNTAAATPGIISIYDANYALVSRTSTQGVSAFTLDSSVVYTVAVTASNLLFNHRTISPSEGGIFRIEGAPNTIPSPSQPGLCVIYGNVYKVDGTTPKSFTLSIQAMSGEFDISGSILTNEFAKTNVASNPKGELKFELYKNRYYRVSMLIDDYYEEPSEIINTYIGDLTSLPLSSFLYPSPSVIDFDSEINSDGDYTFSLSLTNGLTLNKLGDVSAFLEIDTENVDADLRETDGVSNLRVRNSEPGARIDIYGLRGSIVRESSDESGRGTARRLLRTITF